MFAEPTINDFAASIEDHLQRCLGNARLMVRKIERANNAAGCYQGGSTVQQIFRDVLAEFDRGVDGALQRLSHPIQLGKLDALQMRKILGEHLGVYRDQMKNATKHDELRGFSCGPGVERVINSELARFDEILDFKLRQFDVGFSNPGEMQMKHVVIVHGSYNNIITGDSNTAQQGTANSQQTVNSADIIDRLDVLEKALIAAQLPASHHAAIKDHIATINAQLDKQMPSTSVVRGAAQSIMRDVEAAVGGALAHPLAVAASAFLEVIGVF